MLEKDETSFISCRFDMMKIVSKNKKIRVLCVLINRRFSWNLRWDNKQKSSYFGMFWWRPEK